MLDINILIVEDEPILAIELKETLEKLGYYVSAAASTGEKAVELAALHRPNLIIMDIILKGKMDGIEAANKIRSIIKVPIIYLTAYSDEDTVKRAKITEPFGYITKPYDDRDLQIAIDIALYKHEMEKLRESHHWLETVLRSMSDGVIATDNDGRITFMNPSAERLTGLKSNDAIGERLEDVVRIIDENTFTEVKNIVSIVLAKNSAVTSIGSNLLNTADAKDVAIEYIASPIADVHGVLMGVVLTFKDLTSQREAEMESKIRDMTMATSVNAICITDLVGIIKYTNSSFYELWGFRYDEVIGRLITEICQMDVNISEIETSLKTNGKWIGETSAIKKDGTNIFTRLSANNISDQLGRTVYTVYSFIDTT